MNSPSSSTHRRVLDQTEQKWLQDKWYKIDKSGDGVLDMHELGVFLETLRRGISQEDKELAFKDIDADAQGSVEFHEFYDWYTAQDAAAFRDVMFSGAKRELLGGAGLLVMLIFAPMLAIIFAMGLMEDPADFFIALLITVLPTGGLIVACFYDTYGPVIEAQAQAAQQKAFNMAVSVGGASIDTAFAVSHPQQAMKLANQKRKQKKGGTSSPRAVSQNPLDVADSPSPTAGGKTAFESEN